MAAYSTYRPNANFDNPQGAPVALTPSATYEKFTSPLDTPTQTIQFKEHEFMFKQNDHPDKLFQLKSGTVKLFANRSHSRGRTATPEFVTQLIGPGEFFGYQALLGKSPYDVSAQVIRAAEVLVFSQEILQNEVNFSSETFRKVIDQMLKDLRMKEQIREFHYLASVQERIAHQLLILSDKFGVPSPQGTLLSLKLTRNELAQLAGTINESLSRHLTEFKNEGILELKGKEIIIKNRPALVTRAGNFTS